MKSNFKKAFTLIETILAITVIGLVITATAELTQTSMRIGGATMDEFVALHLAEEGIEITRAIRDSSWLQNRMWRNGLNDGTYMVSASPPWNLIRAENLESAPTITLENSENFKRIIKINTDGTNEKIMKITSTVSYVQKNGNQKTISISAELSDWKKGPL